MPYSLPCAPQEDLSNHATLPAVLRVAKKVLHDDQWYSKLRNGGPRKRDLAQSASQATMSYSEARLTRLRRAMPSSATT